MKRTLSLILALIMIVPMFATMVVYAANEPEGTVLYSADYADRFAATGFTEAADASVFGIGVTPIKSGSQKNAANCYSLLTANGLSIGAVKSGVTGLVLDTYDLTQNPSYTISIDMSISTPASDTYLFFGFDYNADGSNKPFNKNTNFRYNGGSKLVVNGDYAYSNEENAKTLWKEIVTNKSVVNYQFVVENNMLTKVIVTCGDVSETYMNAATGLDASKGTFGFTWRADKETTPSSLIKNVTVTVGETKAYEVDFVKLYTERGFAKDMDAVAIHSMGLETFSKTVGTTAPTDPSGIKTQLTDKGYVAYGVNRNTVGAYITEYNLTKNESYILSVDMSVDLPADGLNAYLYFGFGYDATKASYDTFSSITNLRWNGKNSATQKGTLLVNNYTVANANDADALWAASLTNKEVLNYQFVVENNQLVKVIITAGTTAVTYNATAGKALDASKGEFGFALRTGAEGLNPGFTLKKVEVIAHRAADAEPIINILDSNRVVPTEAEREYDDVAGTKYINGYVLHYMDFSKVESFDKTGYFVTNNGDPYGFQIKNGVLDVITGSSNVSMMLTGNSIPQNIQNYTFTVTFRFVEPSEKYLCYIQGNTLDSVTGKTSNEKNTCIRYNGTIDNSSYASKYAQDQAALLQAMQAGEWVTFTYTALDRETAGIVMQCGGKTVKWNKTNNTLAPSNTNMGILFGSGSHIQVSTLQLVAGWSEDYTELIWPAEANALVQNVTTAAIVAEEPVITDAPTAEPPLTDAPTQETTKPVTNAPSNTQAPAATNSNTTANNGGKGGCGSTVAIGAIAAAMLVAVPFVIKRRED